MELADSGCRKIARAVRGNTLCPSAREFHGENKKTLFMGWDFHPIVEIHSKVNSMCCQYGGVLMYTKSVISLVHFKKTKGFSVTPGMRDPPRSAAQRWSQKRII